MAVILLANVGLRDLCVDGELFGEGHRAKGQGILAAYEEYEPRLSAPILLPYVDFILQYLGLEGKLDRLVLFGTEQPEGVAERFRAQDTRWCAEVLTRWLKGQRRGQGGRDRVADARVIPVAVAEPHRYDLAFAFFSSVWQHRHLRDLAEVDTCFVGMAGGIPATNAALLLRAVERFGTACVALHQAEGQPAPTPLRFGEQVRRTGQRRLAADLLGRRQFGAAAAVLEAMGLPPLAALAQALQRRLDFDFAAGWRELVRATTQQGWVGLPRISQSIDRLRCELEVLAPPGTQAPDPEAALRELYWNAALCREQGRLVDLLVRAFCLMENAAALAAARALLPETLATAGGGPAAGRGVKRRLAELPQQRPALRDFLAAQHPLVRTGEQFPDTPLYLALLGCAQAGGDGSVPPAQAAAAGRVAQLILHLERAKKLRNESISAHELAGVSEDALRIAVPEWREFPAGSEGVVNLMGALLTALEIPKGEDPYAWWAGELPRHLVTLAD